MTETAEVVDLPHTWNNKDGQDGGNDYFRGSCCYVKKIGKCELPEGEKYFLEINGATILQMCMSMERSLHIMTMAILHGVWILQVC